MTQPLHRRNNSLHRPPDRAIRQSIWTFVIALAGLSAATIATGRLMAPHAMPMAVAEAELPPADHYLAHGRAGHTDHHVLYHGLDPTSHERLETADVLWLGNSRLLFALNRQALRRFFTPRGLTYFVLGFGHDETFHFATSILDRWVLRPKVVVVNVDQFFVGPPSEWAQRVIADSRFDGWKWWFESEASHLARRTLHRWVPHWPDILEGRREFIVHRSRLDGTWFVGTVPKDVGPLPVAEIDVPPSVERIANARRFVARMREQGTEVIFCLVPGPVTSRATAEALAQAAGVALLAPEVEMPLTIDGSHLAPESATEVAVLLLEGLDAHLDQLGL